MPMQIKAIFLDLDGTVYSPDNGMWEKIAARMEMYMHQVLGIPKNDILELRKKYFKKYGTTLKGLQTNFTIDPEDYLSFVHDIPVGAFIKRDESLRQILDTLPQSKWILTNSNKEHAMRVLTALGVEDQFKDIFGVAEMQYHNKPDPYVFQKALENAGGIPPSKCLFVDDIPQNLVPAWEMGFTTVLVGNNPKNFATHYSIDRIHDLPDALPILKD